MRDRDGKSRGFGFITYDSDTTVDSVVGMDHSLSDKPVEVKKVMVGLFGEFEVKSNARRLSQSLINFRGLHFKIVARATRAEAVLVGAAVAETMTVIHI